MEDFVWCDTDDRQRSHPASDWIFHRDGATTDLDSELTCSACLIRSLALRRELVYTPAVHRHFYPDLCG